MHVEKINYQNASAGADLVRSLEQTGFAVLDNHPIPPAQIKAIYQAWEGFFKDPAKQDYLYDPKTQDGYFPYLSENAKGVKAKDLKEFYHVYPWGKVPESLSKITFDFYDAMFNLAHELLGWIDQNSPAEAKKHYSEPLANMLKGSNQSLLRILHYPPLEGEVEAGAIRAAAHEDINLITLLVTGSAPGLQAKDNQGNWHDVPCDESMITINSGDMLKLASGNYFPSTTHRVVNPDLGAGNNGGGIKNTSRFSLPMFAHPRPEVYLGEGMSAGDYLNKRLQEIGLIKS